MGLLETLGRKVKRKEEHLVNNVCSRNLKVRENKNGRMEISDGYPIKESRGISTAPN